MKVFDSFTDRVEQAIARKSNKIAPGVASPLAREYPRVFLIQGCPYFVLFAQKTQKDEIGKLLYGIHGIIDTTCPKDVHELVDLLTKPGREEVRSVGFS